MGCGGNGSMDRIDWRPQAPFGAKSKKKYCNHEILLDTWFLWFSDSSYTIVKLTSVFKKNPKIILSFTVNFRIRNLQMKEVRLYLLIVWNWLYQLYILTLSYNVYNSRYSIRNLTFFSIFYLIVGIKPQISD